MFELITVMIRIEFFYQFDNVCVLSSIHFFSSQYIIVRIAKDFVPEIVENTSSVHIGNILKIFSLGFD